MRMAIAVMVFLAGGLLLAAPLVHMNMNPPPEAVIMLRKVQALSDLAVLRVPVHLLHEAGIDGLSGGVRTLVQVEGSVDLGVDLSRARLIQIDPVARTAVLQLPPAKVIHATVDMAATRVLRVDRRGLWWVVPGEAGGREVIQKALAQAQHKVQRAGDKSEHLRQAEQRARQLCIELAAEAGWTLR